MAACLSPYGVHSPGVNHADHINPLPLGGEIQRWSFSAVRIHIAYVAGTLRFAHELIVPRGSSIAWFYSFDMYREHHILCRILSVWALSKCVHWTGITFSHLHLSTRFQYAALSLVGIGSVFCASGVISIGEVCVAIKAFGC
jgi:hypothetical protein